MVFFGPNQASFNITDAELRKCSVLASWLLRCLKAHYPRQPFDPIVPTASLFSAVIRDHREQPELFLWELASSQFSLSALWKKAPVPSTSPPDISAEIHLAVRKQLLFIKGRGWCNFNFKDALNELPPGDWSAVRNSPPVPLNTSTEVFNYAPLELLLAPVWYASCMGGEWIFTTWLPTLYSIIAHNVIRWKCTVIKVEGCCLGIKAFSYLCIHLSAYSHS